MYSRTGAAVGRSNGPRAAQRLSTGGRNVDSHRTRLRFVDRSLVLWTLVTLAVAATVVSVDLAVISHRGLTPTISSNVRFAEESYESGSFDQPSTHPPLLTAMLLSLRYLGLGVNPWAFSLAFLAAGTAALWGLSRYLLGRTELAFAVVLLALVNPFFVWVGLLYRDAAAALLFVTLAIWAALKIGDRVRSGQEGSSARATWVLGASALAAGVLLALTRGSGIFISAAVFVIAFLIARRRSERKLWIVVALSFVGFVALYAAYNQARVGVFTVSTNNGFNLYLGNHPSYLHAHPLYDVDVFLGAAASAEGFDKLSEADRDRAYTRKAWQFIKDDPVAFLYRSIRNPYGTGSTLRGYPTTRRRPR